MAFGSSWRPVEVRWQEGRKAQEKPKELFLEGGRQKVELLGEELREGPEPGSARRRRFKLMSAGAVYLLEGPFAGDVWKVCGPCASLED